MLPLSLKEKKNVRSENERKINREINGEIKRGKESQVGFILIFSCIAASEFFMIFISNYPLVQSIREK